VKSSALRLGASAPKAVAIFYSICVLLAAGAAAAAHLGPLVVVFLAAYGLHLFWQTLRLRVEDGASALRLFKSNREAGLILFLGLMAGALQHGGLFGFHR
jgi:4-hydroxybenzoate polyprenyltransferase